MSADLLVTILETIINLALLAFLVKLVFKLKTESCKRAWLFSGWYGCLYFPSFVSL